MDYEDLKYMNDDVHEVNKGNFHSDTEVQRAGLTKFVIEENLEVQLRFDGLDEAHILLGESGHCEDHWGSGFRRQDNSFELETTLHNIPFSSNGANTYNSSSVLRPINVWSEATSPESVQMLLNSIRQDEINLTTEGNLFGPDIGELISSSDNQAEINMWSVSKGSKRESLPSRLLDILGDELENTGKKNQLASEQSGMDLRKGTKDQAILLNGSEQCCSLFAVNSSSVVDCRPAQNKNIPMIGLCSEVKLKQGTHNLAPNADSTQVNAENKNGGNEDFGFQTEGADNAEDEELLNSVWAEETEGMGCSKFLEFRVRREGKRGKLQNTEIMCPERRDFDSLVQSQHEATNASGQSAIQLPDSVWDEGDGVSQERQLDRVSQEDILSSEMQGLTELCSYKKDEDSIQEASQYGFIIFDMQRIENCTSDGEEGKRCIGNKNWMEAGNERGEDLSPFMRIEKSLDNATLDVSYHQVRTDFKHTHIPGMLDSLLDENKKENVEEQFNESYGDCVAVEELSGVSEKGAKEAVVRVTLKGIPESLLDESNQTCSIVSPEDAVLADIEEMPDLIFDVRKEDQTTMHANEPSQWDHLAAKMEGVLDRFVDGDKQCTSVGCVNNLDASDNAEVEVCEFTRKRDISVEEAREINTVNGSSYEVMDILGQRESHWVSGSVVKHVKEESLENTQKTEMTGYLNYFLDERSECAGVTTHEDIAFANVHSRLEFVIDVNDETDVEMHVTQVDCKNAVTEAVCSVSDFMLDEKKEMKGRHDLREPGDEGNKNITKYSRTGDFLNVEARICDMGRSSQEKNALFGSEEIQGMSLVTATDINNAGKHSTGTLQENAALVDKQGVLDFSPCKSIVKNTALVENNIALDLSLDETSGNDVRMHTTYALDEAAATVHLQRLPLCAGNEKNSGKHSEASVEEMEEMDVRLSEKYKAGKNFVGACQDAVLENQMQRMFSSILYESSQAIPQNHDMETAEADITMVGLQEVSKPLVHINENPPKQEFEGLQESHLDGVQLLGSDNEQKVVNSPWILQKSQTAHVLTKGKSLTKIQVNRHNENNALLKDSGSGHKNVMEEKFPVMDVEMGNNSQCVWKRKTPEYAQVSVTKVSSASLSQREEESSSLVLQTSKNMAHTYNDKSASSMEKAEMIYMGSGTSGFMASEVQEPEDISRLQFGGPAFVPLRTTSVDTVLCNKDITEPSKANCAHRKALSAIQGHEVQEDGHASPHKRKASLVNHLPVGNAGCVITCNSDSRGCEVAMQTLQVLPQANLQAETACEQATHYHNGGSQIVKALGTDIINLQNVQALNVSLLKESKKFDKSVIANLSESDAVKSSETKKISTSIEPLPLHKESTIDACKQAMQIAQMVMAAENGDIDKTGPLVEEPEKIEKSAQLIPEATYHQNLNDPTFPIEKIVTDGYQQAMQIAQFGMKIVDRCAKQTEHSNLEFQKSGEAVVISMDMESDHTRQTGLMNVEFEESSKAMGSTTEMEDDLTQQSAHMNPESGENVEVTRTSIEIKDSLTKDDLMSLESEHGFRTARTSMKIESDKYEKACLIIQESKIGVNVGCTAFEATAQDGRQPKSCNEQCVLTSDSGNRSIQGRGKLHHLVNLGKDVKEATIAGSDVPCMTGKVADKDEEIEKEKFKVKAPEMTSEIGLESVSSTIGKCELSPGGVFPDDGKESVKECDIPLVQCSCKYKDEQVGAERLQTRIQPLECLNCKDAEVQSKKFEAGIQQTEEMMACNSMSQSDGISTPRVHSGKPFSEGSGKLPAIMPNSEHGKPLKARQPNEIFQNTVSEDLTECRRDQPEGSNMTITFQNAVENVGTQNSVVCEMCLMPQEGNFYQTACEKNKEKSHLVISSNELDGSSSERSETCFCSTVDLKGAPVSSENHSPSITWPSCACHPDISTQCQLLSNVSVLTLSNLNTTEVPVPASIQQLFSDSQQLQLRAQILVYGSLIQGSLPEESLMKAAFGDIIATCSGSVSSNQREKLWEQSWRLAAAKIQGKIFSNACEVHTPRTSLLNMSSVLGSTMFAGGMKTVSPAMSLSDSGVMGMKSVHLVAAKGHSPSSSLESSPNMDRVGHMDNPSAFMSLPSPFSSPSPVWRMSTPIHEGVQLTNVARNLYLDSPKITPSRHISLTPQPGKYVMGSTAYWTSCSPSLPWVTPQAKSESELSFSPFVVPEPIREILNDGSSVPLFMPCKMTRSLAPSVSSTMIGTAIPWVGTNNKMDAQKGGMGIEGQLSIEQIPKKKRKSRLLEGIAETSRLISARLTTPASGGSIPLPMSQVVVSQGSSVVARNSHDAEMSNSFLTTGSSMPFVPSPSYYQIISREGQHRVIFSEETAGSTEQARLYSEEAASFAATAVKDSQFIWSQLVAQAESGASPDCEAKLASSAATASVAAAVAEAAAAAAKVAHEAALQAKLVASEALNSDNTLHDIQSGVAKGGNPGHQGQGIHKLSSITKVRQKDTSPCLLMSNACHSIDRNSEAVSVATKRAQNLDAVERAAGLASEAVSQAGAVITMGDPLLLSLNTLLNAGPDGYQKLGTHGARVFERYDGLQAGVQLIKKVGIENSENSLRLLKEKENKEELGKETLKEVQGGVQDSRRAFSKRLLDDLQCDTCPIGEDSEAQKENCVPDSIQTGMSVVDLQAGTRTKVVRPEDEPATNMQEDSLGLKSNQLRDGSLVEVVSDDKGLHVVWHSAKVLRLQAGKALVCYDELLSDEGSIHLQEWIPLKGDSGKAPRIRMAHHMIAMKFQGTRKRRREAMNNHVWSVGDHVDAWIHDGWWEGIITGMSEEDENGVTVNFPGKVDTLLIKVWNLRPSLVWKDGQWVEWRNSNVEKVAHEDDVPLRKRQKVDKEDTVSKEKSNENLHRVPNVEESNRDQELSVVISSANGLKSSVVKISREGRSAMNSKAHHAEQTEASRFHGLPKPAKKKKFMDVSTHYSADKMVKNSPKGKPTNKMDKYKTMLAHSQSGLETNKFECMKANKSTLPKPRELRYGNGGQNKAQPEKDKSYVVNKTALRNTTSSHEFVMGHNPAISDGRRAGRKVVGSDASSLFAPVEVSHKPSPFTQGKPFSAVNADQGSKQKSSTLKSSSQNSENNIFRQEKTSKERGPLKIAPDHIQPRRSNRRFQPSSKLLEGLQSNIFSHEKRGKGNAAG